MEVPLNQRQKIKQLFKKLNINAELTLQKLCKPAIAKKVLLHYLDELEQNRSPLLNFKTTDDATFLALLAIHNATITPKEAMMTFGLKKALETTTLRELKMMFGKNNAQAWYRCMKSIENSKLPSTTRSFEPLREQLVIFKALKI